MRILAIDYGQKRIGLALSDRQGHMALPYTTLLKKETSALFQHLQEIIQSEEVQCLVVGLPVGLDGEETLSTRQARNFAQRLGRLTSLPVHLQDETLSSAEAAQRLHQTGMKGKKKKAVLDQMAAVIILESFLQSFRNTDMGPLA